MPYKAYSLAAKADAVATAEVLGLSAASEQLGIPEETIKSWMLKAGRRPADTIESASWARFARLAMSKAERMVAEGKLSAAQLLNAATMAEQRAAAVAKEKGDERTPDDDLIAWIDEKYADPEQRRLARSVTTSVIVWTLRLGDPTPGPDVADEPDPAAGEWVNDALRRVLEGTADLGAMAERFATARRQWDERERVIAKRAAVLAQSGMAYHSARDMAAELTDDYPPPDLAGLLLEMP